MTRRAHGRLALRALVGGASLFCLGAAWAQPTQSTPPAPPDLSQLAPAPAASAPASAASAPRRRCVAGCDGGSSRVQWSEDASNRFEEHRDGRGELVRLYVHPKSGAPRYEIKVGPGRSRDAGSRRSENAAELLSSPREGQAVWELLRF